MKCRMCVCGEVRINEKMTESKNKKGLLHKASLTEMRLKV